jgi:His-Xaa-Ser system radical SAM maturase HxsC
MLKLSSRQLRVLSEPEPEPFVVRLTSNAELPLAVRGTDGLLVDSPAGLPPGFRAYFLRADPLEEATLPANCFALPESLAYLADGDVIRVSPSRGALAVLYRKASPSNSLLVTERCNHLCLMCSQPPKEADDSYLVDELLRAVPLFDSATREVGLTGGEPTLLGPRLLELIGTLRSYLPRTAVHLLSNGRRFADDEFTAALAAIRHPDLMIGIPLYADVSEVHDYVVQANGAFDETIRGILALKRAGIRVEIRFVIHRDTYQRLPQFAEFMARNLVFVDHVALMGLEPIGFAKANASRIWIDPVEYQSELGKAANTLAHAGMNVSIYNHQLCVLDRRLWPFARQSISDWKNEYLPPCADCSVRQQCGGFFSSAMTMHSAHIKAVSLEGG